MQLDALRRVIIQTDSLPRVLKVLVGSSPLNKKSEAYVWQAVNHGLALDGKKPLPNGAIHHSLMILLGAGLVCQQSADYFITELGKATLDGLEHDQDSEMTA